MIYCELNVAALWSTLAAAMETQSDIRHKHNKLVFLYICLLLMTLSTFQHAAHCDSCNDTWHPPCCHALPSPSTHVVQWADGSQGSSEATLFCVASVPRTIFTSIINHRTDWADVKGKREVVQNDRERERTTEDDNDKDKLF